MKLLTTTTALCTWDWKTYGLFPHEPIVAFAYGLPLNHPRVALAVAYYAPAPLLALKNYFGCFGW